jgi:hypothetical protein
MKVRKGIEGLTVDFYVVWEMSINGVNDLLPVDVALIGLLLDGFLFFRGVFWDLFAIG